MAVSTVTLAKRIKATIQGHAAIVERDGTQAVPSAFNFNFGGEGLGAGKQTKTKTYKNHPSGFNYI